MKYVLVYYGGGMPESHAAQARLLMKRPLQFGQDARIFPGHESNGKRCPGAGTRGVAGATGNRFAAGKRSR